MRYRVLTVNIGPRERMSDWSNTATQTTEESTKPDKPEGLVAEAIGLSMINLMWNIQSRTPPAAPILAYIIEHMMGEEWVQVARITDADSADNQNDVVRTIHTDTGLDAETDRTYRVRAQNEPALGTMDVSEESEHAEATTDAAMAPGVPTAVTAMETSDTEITVSWTAPADNGGAAITGYMVERGTMGADSAMSWMAVDPAHTDTAMMYMDMSLMPMTTYYYRVSAMNSAGTGAMSDGMDMAMTYRTNTAPTADGTIADMTLKADQMSSGMDVTGYFSDADMGDTLTYTARSNMPMYATVAVSGKMVTVTGVAAGTATITVTATDIADATATQDIMVTVEAADTTLTAPSGVVVSSLRDTVSVTWDPASIENADQVKVVLFDSGVTEIVDLQTFNAANDPGAATFTNVDSGTYKVTVASFRTGDRHKLSLPLEEVTVE